jgi:hypothetical protein
MNSTLATIQALEVELHHPGVRCDVQRLEQLLHKDFHEVGRSGREYDRVTVVRFLSEQKASSQVISENFTLQRLEPGISLLTYRSAHLKPDGTLENYTLRSSIWVQVGAQWQLIYHQGTPAAQPW